MNLPGRNPAADAGDLLVTTDFTAGYGDAVCRDDDGAERMEMITGGEEKGDLV